jgi:divalent metal cation (Fe/Co/Zn/Cd) transporter
MAVHNVSVHVDKGQLYVDLHLEVDDHLSLSQAHEMASHLEADLREDMPEIQKIVTHIESRGTGVGDDHDVTAEEARLVERIRMLTDEIVGKPCCHDVMVRRQGDKYIVSLHCLFAKELPIVEAHKIATTIEEYLKATVPDLDRILVHVEPEGK